MTANISPLLDDARDRLVEALDITYDAAVKINLRDMIRMIYTATITAQELNPDSNPDLARDLIFLPACSAALTMVCASLGMIDTLAAIGISKMQVNPFVEVIGDLFNE